MTDPLKTLTQINLDDLISSFGWQNSAFLSALLQTIFHLPAQKFAQQMLYFDDLVAKSDLPKAARLGIKPFAQSVHVYGSQNLPASGPAIFLSNHPGIADTLALFAAINRTDLNIIAVQRPFLQSLINTSQHLLYLSDNPSERMGVVKKTVAHLKNGGSVLTFPAGEIEPDANVYPGAVEALEGWTDSAGVFVRFAPQTQIIPTFVRGVLWDKAVKHPLTYIKKDNFEREKLGAAFQLLAHIAFNLNPPKITVQFGQPISIASVGSNDPKLLHQAVLEQMRLLVSQPPHGRTGESAL